MNHPQKREKKERNEDTLREILDKYFIVTVMQDDNTFNIGHYHFQVKSTECMTNKDVGSPTITQRNTSKPSCTTLFIYYGIKQHSTTQTSLLGTAPSTEFGRGTNEKLLSHYYEV